FFARQSKATPPDLQGIHFLANPPGQKQMLRKEHLRRLPHFASARLETPLAFRNSGAQRFLPCCAPECCVHPHSSSRSVDSSRQPSLPPPCSLHVPKGPPFNRPVPYRRATRGPGKSRIEVGNIDQVVAAELFF